MVSEDGHEEGGAPADTPDGAEAEGFDGMGLARRVLKTLLGGLEKKAGALVWKFAKPHAESLWNLLKKKLTTQTAAGESKPSQALESFKNNLNTPEYHAVLTIALSDALKQKDFREEVLRLLNEAEGGTPSVRQTINAGDHSVNIQIGRDAHGNITTGKQDP